MRQIFIFVDGLGLAPASPDNPVNADVCPFLCDLIAHSSKPIDACLGIDGLPQSATGQATLSGNSVTASGEAQGGAVHAAGLKLTGKAIASNNSVKSTSGSAYGGFVSLSGPSLAFSGGDTLVKDNEASGVRVRSKGIQRYVDRIWSEGCPNCGREVERIDEPWN